MDDELDEIRNNRPVGIDVGTWLPEPSDISSLGLVGNLFEAIVALLIAITRAAPPKESTRLRSELERLVLWGGSFALSDGQLDEVLSRSSELRHAILSALSELGTVVKDDLIPALGINDQKSQNRGGIHTRDLQLLLEKAATVLDGSDEESLSDDGSLRSDIDDILDDVTIYIDCLLDLSPALDSPVLDPELDGPSHADVETFNVSSSQAMVFCRHIRDRFPKMAKYLVERLGEANAARADRIKTARDKAAEHKDLAAYGLRRPLPMISDRHSESGPRMTASSARLTQETHSVFDEPYPAPTPSKDRLFRDDASFTTFASASTSFYTIQKGRPRVPPLPSEAAEGKPFTCLVCHQTLGRTYTRAAWKKHVFEDLQPYVCTVQGCTKPRTRFHSGLEWANHEATHQNKTRADTACSMCNSESGKEFASSVNYYKHVAEHLREIALAVLPQNLEADEDDSDESDEFVSAPEVLKSHWMVPFDRNTDFVGRDSILDQVLYEVDQSLSGNSPHNIALLGLGGIGKSQVALEALYRIHEQDPNCSVFWISAGDVSNAEMAYREIGRRLHVKGIDEQGVDVQHLVSSALSKESGKWIMVIDNADHISPFTSKDNDDSSIMPFDWDLPSEGNGAIIVTTRSRSIATRMGDGIIEIHALERADTIEMLSTRLTELQLGDAGSTEELLDILEDHPLAVQQALAYMNRTGLTTTEYVHKIESERESGPEKPEITIEDLAARNPDAFEYLKLLSFMAKHRIPHSMLPPAMKATEGEAINTLETFGFASHKKNQSVHVHGLVHRAVHSWLDKREELEQHVTEVIQRLVEAYPCPAYENRTAWSQYLPHAESVLCFRERCTDQNALSELLFKVGASLYILGDYRRSEDRLTQSLNLKEDIYIPHPEVFAISNYLLSVRLQLGYFTTAEELQDIVKSLVSACPGSEHADIARSINNVALALDHQGQYAQAERLHRKALASFQKSLGEEHIETLRSMNNLASVLKSQEQYDDALRMHREALDGFRKVLGADHPDTLMSMNNLAVLYACLGKYAAAEENFREVQRGLHKAIGEEHPNTLVATKNLADILFERGRYKNAEICYAKAVAGLERTLGTGHPWTQLCSEGLAVSRRAV